MKLIYCYGIAHFLTMCFFILLEYSKSKSFYFTSISIVEKNGLHLLFGGFLFYILYLLFCITLQHFIGELRSDEISTVNENCFLFLTDFLLIITIFSDELSILNLLIMCYLLGLKCINWIFYIRMQTQDIKLVFLGLIITLFSFESFIFSFVNAYLFSGMCILFAFEFLIVFLSSQKNLVLFLVEGRFGGDKKIIYKFMVEIFYTAFRLVSYISFFIITAYKYRVPFNILRELISTFKKLVKKIKNLAAFNEIVSFLEACEDVTDGNCPICAEDMILGKKIHCGHSFHIECLKRWTEQQQVCPLCRRSLFDNQRKIVVENSEDVLTGIEVDTLS